VLTGALLAELDQVQRQQVPIIGEGQGVSGFVHIDAAAGATAPRAGVPAWRVQHRRRKPVAAFARAAEAPTPPRLSEEEALRMLGSDGVYYVTRLRGASNEKAQRELQFRPRSLGWI
jgi:hypothetical protein